MNSELSDKLVGLGLVAAFVLFIWAIGSPDKPNTGKPYNMSDTEWYGTQNRFIEAGMTRVQAREATRECNKYKDVFGKHD